MRVVYLGGFADGFPDQVAGSGWFTCGIRSPWNPPTDPLPGTLELFPISTSLLNAMKWFWKVKKWHMEWEYDDAGGHHSGSEDSVASATDERDLFTKNGLQFGFATLPSTLTIAAQTPGSVYGVYQESANLFRPRVNWTGTGMDTFTSTNPLVGDLTFDGFSVPIYSADPVSNVLITFTPLEYWPYAKVDNTEPIYDSSTGAELLDPFDHQDPLA